jgi:hypothetical protein
MELKFKNLAGKIVMFRKRLHVNQAAFGEKFTPPVKRSTIAHWETMRSEPTAHQIIQMAAFEGDRAWWHTLHFFDDVVSAEDNVDYDKNGRRVNWVTPEDLEEMSRGDDDDKEYWEWMMQQEAAPPKEGVLFEALKLDPEKQYAAIQNLLKQPSTDNQSTLGGLAAVDILLKKRNEEDKELAWLRKTKNFRQAVNHALTKRMPQAYDHIDQLFKKGALVGKADYFDGTSVVLIVTEQIKAKNDALARNLGKLLLLERMNEKPLHKMLAFTIDLENPKVNHLMLDDVSVARNLGITLTYVTPDDEEALAQEIKEFVVANLEKKAEKHKSQPSVDF